MKKHYIAIDLGAESGRVMLGTIAEGRLGLSQCHRFPNQPVEEKGSLRWDFDSLLTGVKTGIAHAVKEAGSDISGLAVDSWGVDFGLLDESGRLLENPYHYRDSRTDGVMRDAFARLSRRDMYGCTGIQFMQINTLYQLLACKRDRPELLGRARKLLFMADLVAYHLTGADFAEYTLASTSQLLDMHKGSWAEKLFSVFGLPFEIMPEVVRPATEIAALDPQVMPENFSGLVASRIPVIAAASHDTAAAVAAIPAQTENWAYLSCGTWSLMGVELAQPIIDDRTFAEQFTNEGGVAGTIRLLKNISGLWLLQECRRYWQQQGDEFSYEQLTSMATNAEPFTACIDPARPEFIQPGDMPEKINRYLARSGQSPINDKGRMCRAILESLAFEYRRVLEKIEDIIGRRIEVLHMVGGGVKNELLCRFTADAIGRKVITGPVEATAAGNVIVQAMATGHISSLAAGRDIIRASVQLKQYEPHEPEVWDSKYKEFVGSRTD